MKQTSNSVRSVSLSSDADDSQTGDETVVPKSKHGRLELRTTPRASVEPYDRLTGRERWVVAQLVKHKGAPNKAIAYALQISPNTLRNHLASIYAKLGVRRRVELVLYAIERGLDQASDR